jgi:hypothetical protein
MGLETVKVLMDIEDYFHVGVPDEAASEVVTVADLQAVIVSLLVKQGDMDSEKTRREVWDGMMKILANNGYDVRLIHPNSRWIEDIFRYE